MWRNEEAVRLDAFSCRRIGQETVDGLCSCRECPCARQLIHNVMGDSKQMCFMADAGTRSIEGISALRQIGVTSAPACQLVAVQRVCEV